MHAALKIVIRVNSDSSDSSADNSEVKNENIDSVRSDSKETVELFKLLVDNLRVWDFRNNATFCSHTT